MRLNQALFSPHSCFVMILPHWNCAAGVCNKALTMSQVPLACLKSLGGVKFLLPFISLPNLSPLKDDTLRSFKLDPYVTLCAGVFSR